VNRPDTLPATVFDRLCQHPVVNGQALAQELGVSRAAIWKAVRFLRLTGLPIDAVSGRGYRLACPLSPLEAKTLNTQPPDKRRFCVGRTPVSGTRPSGSPVAQRAGVFRVAFGPLAFCQWHRRSGRPEPGGGRCGGAHRGIFWLATGPQVAQ